MRAVHIYITLILLAAATGCQGQGIVRDLPEKRFPTSVTFDASFDIVWKAACEVVFNNWPVKAIDMSAGIISTSQIDGKSDYIYSTNMFSEERAFLPAKYSFNIGLFRTDGKVRLKVKLFEWVAVTENTGTVDNPNFSTSWERVHSSTHREAELINAIIEKVDRMVGPKSRFDHVLAKIDGFIKKKDFKKAIDLMNTARELLEDDDPLRARLKLKLQEIEKLADTSKGEGK